MRRRELYLIVWAVCTALLGTRARAEAQDVGVDSQVDAEARVEFEAGRDAYEHAEFGAALLHFERAYQLSHRPKLLFNIARAADADGQRMRAISAYEQYLEHMQDADNREFTAARLRWLREHAARESTEPAPQPPSAPAGREASPPHAEQVLRPWQRMRFHAGPYLGVGGKLRLTTDLVGGLTGALDPTFGMQLGSEVILNRWLGIGGELRASSYRGGDWTNGRDVLLDVLARPTGRYQFADGVELYAGLPVGLTVPRLAAPGAGSFSERPGLNIAVLIGVLYPVASHFALALEAGYSWHTFSAYLLDDYEPKITYRVGQGMLALNAVVPVTAFAR